MLLTIRKRSRVNNAEKKRREAFKHGAHKNTYTNVKLGQNKRVTNRQHRYNTDRPEAQIELTYKGDQRYL